MFEFCVKNLTCTSMPGQSVEKLKSLQTTQTKFDPAILLKKNLKNHQHLIAIRNFIHLLCTTNMTRTDERLVVGGQVHALAKHVTSEAETKRLCGSNWKTKFVSSF